MRQPPPQTTSDLLREEVGSTRKKWTGLLPIGLVFPNSYALGMSNLGFQLVYELLNQHPAVVCERLFIDGEPGLIRSIESGRPLKDFPLLFFSVSFEQDYLQVVQVVRHLFDEPLHHRRGQHRIGAGQPLLAAGGVATFMNPEPLAPYMDLFYLGEAEEKLPELIDLLVERFDDAEKNALLEEIADRIPCCYVPRLYSFVHKKPGQLAAIKPAAGRPDRIEKCVFKGKEQAGHSVILSPAAEFSSIYLTELGRGCSRGCRFCTAGYIYRPARLWSAEAVLASFRERPEGVERIGLLGMEMANPSELATIVAYLENNGCQLSFSSLRADRIDPLLLRLLSRSGIKTVAIAPDGGSERLRRVINKNISAAEVLAATEQLVEAGVRNLKLYFMIGLPTETREDLEELVELTMQAREVLLRVGRGKGVLGSLTLSVNSFVPKPWTPFQYHPFCRVEVLRERIGFLKKTFARTPNIRLMTDQPERVLLQAMLARGDRLVGEALLGVEKVRSWQQVFRKAGIDAAEYVYRERQKDEVFPWDIVGHGINKEYLWKEYQQSLVCR